MAEMGLYTGCIIADRYPGIEAATRIVMPQLGVDLVDMNGTSCCPAPGVIRSISREAWISLGSRNLALAGDREILTLCNGCYSTLSDVRKEVENPVVRQRLEELNVPVGSSDVRHIAEYISREFNPEHISDIIAREIPLKTAIHYGCHILSPREDREWADVEHPTFMDELVEAMGLSCVDYQEKRTCCGAGGGVLTSDSISALEKGRNKIEAIKESGAECIITACPLCLLQLESAQDEQGIPVLHLAEVLALALGSSPDEIGLSQHKVSCEIIIAALETDTSEESGSE